MMKSSLHNSTKELHRCAFFPSESTCSVTSKCTAAVFVSSTNKKSYEYLFNLWWITPRCGFSSSFHLTSFFLRWTPSAVSTCCVLTPFMSFCYIILLSVCFLWTENTFQHFLLSSKQTTRQQIGKPLPESGVNYQKRKRKKLRKRC